MSLSLLAPWFLAGLGALLVPVLVHLVHRERSDPRPFPSLMFLRRVPYPFSARQKIRDWLLFLTRAGLVALAALAFARPLVARNAAAADAGRRGREVVVLLDRSFSMQYGDRWTRAREAAQRAIASAGSGDRVTLVPFDRYASTVNEPTADQTLLRAALDSLRPTDRGTRLSSAIAVAQRVLAGSTLAQRELVVVSDFQRSGWDLGDESALPAGTTVTPVDVGQGAVRDRSVRGVDVRRDPSGDATRVVVVARVANVGPPQRAVGATLVIGNREAGRARVDLPADGGAAVVFPAVAVPAAATPARVVVEGDELTGDDSYHFLLTRAPSMAALVVDHRDAPSERSVFLARALEIGDQPSFEVTSRRTDRVTPADLVGKRLVILSDAGVPASVGVARLEAFVRGGGGLLTVLGERTSSRTWPRDGMALLPGTVGQPIDRLAGRGALLGFIDRTHPALSIFSGARSGDLSAARFFRYRPIEAADGVLARFDDGRPALIEHTLGQGRIVTVATSFDGVWNDLPRQAVFLPFVHQLARHAASYRDVKRAYTIGEAVNPRDLAALRPDSSPAGDRWSATTPSGKRVAVGGTEARSALELAEAGVYEVRPGGSPNAQPRLIAANVAPGELDFATYDVAQLTNALAPIGASTPVAGDTDSQVTAADRERKQSLWWYMLLVAAGLVFAETFLARRTAARRLASA